MESVSIYGVEMYTASVIAQALTVFILSGAYDDELLVLQVL